MSRSTRAVKPSQALDQATAIFGTYKPKPQFQLSDYATGKRQRWKRNPKAGSNESTTASTSPRTTAEWFIHNLASSLFPFTGFTSIGAALHLASGIRRSKRAPSVYPFQITDLLEYEARQKHSQNKILGEKIAKILHQNTDFSDEIAIQSQTPSEKLKKDPIMALVTKTISTYMLVKHSKTHKSYQKNKTYPPGGSHFSKRRSESENTNYHQQGNIYDQCQKVTSKNDTQSESDDVTVKSEENLKTMTKIDDEAKTIARDDEVKAITKTLKEFRARKEKQIDRKIETRASITLPHPFATTSHISILTFTIFICTFNILIAIFNSLVPDPLDQHYQTFTIGDLSDCKLRHLSQQTASNQADTVVKTLANPDSIRPFKIPGTWPEGHYKNRFRNPLVPSHLTPDRVRKSETKFHHVAFIFQYLDFSR